ncbi:MAG: ABC transporter ATP-binding protein [Patescibacteria group bacterium]|nr:ABC transporter ATP-binding protein [Patescibacteria group bacterium]
MIALKNVTKFFGATKAVDDISFSVKDGEIVGFLGPNGAGKTTTMRMMTGFYTPDSGTIEVQGDIGYLPENNPLYKDMLVSEHLEFSAELKGLYGSKRRDAINFVIQSVSIEDVYYVPVKELSKGYRQRVGIAQALLHKPKILVMDEPSEGLDPNQRTEIRALIKNLSQRHTIIMSTHVMQEVEAVCNRMIIIHRGRIVADGTPSELVKKAGAKRQIVIDVEGKKVEETLSSIKGVEDVQVKKGRDGIVHAIVTIGKTAKIQPEVSRKAAELGWILWRITEEEKHLEDVFHALTESV